VIDLCGTGGAPLKTFNLSSVASVVVAAVGVPVAKHGNRSFTATCGSADLFEALGVRLDIEPPEVARILDEVGLAFLYAPKFHPAMRHVAAVRKEIGVRTVFNLLGPLANPAGASAQLLGVSSSHLVRLLPEVLRALGVTRALVVHHQDGADEILPMGETAVAELRDGGIEGSTLVPGDWGARKTTLEEVANVAPKEAAARAVQVLRGEGPPGLAEAVAVNAAAALYVAGRERTYPTALETARKVLESGAGLEKLGALVAATGGAPSWRGA
jgi:anthranilate phosphoribosyltransferase